MLLPLLFLARPADACVTSGDGPDLFLADTIVRARVVAEGPRIPIAKHELGKQLMALYQVKVSSSTAAFQKAARRAAKGAKEWYAETSIAIIELEVIETLKGKPPSGRLRVAGKIVEQTARHYGEVPYRAARRSADAPCFAYDYSMGKDYVLFIAGGILYYAPLAPLNEEITGNDDPWLKWVRAEIERRKRYEK